MSWYHVYLYATDNLSYNKTPAASRDVQHKIGTYSVKIYLVNLMGNYLQ